MSAYESIKSKLNEVGIYSITDESNISDELRVYGEELDLIADLLDEMLRELFVDTAESYGLSERERALGKEKSDFSIDQRREMLKISEQVSGERCTAQRFERFLTGCGISNFSLTEVVSKQRVIITVLDTLTSAQMSELDTKVSGELPLRLSYKLSYSDSEEE